LFFKIIFTIYFSLFFLNCNVSQVLGNLFSLTFFRKMVVAKSSLERKELVTELDAAQKSLGFSTSDTTYLKLNNKLLLVMYDIREVQAYLYSFQNYQGHSHFWG